MYSDYPVFKYLNKNFKSLYIHIPFCYSKCSYCDFFSVPVKEIPDEYVEALCTELDFCLKNHTSLHEIETIYIGGGTPSILSLNQIQKITQVLNRYIKNPEEFTCEVNPDDVNEELIDCLWKCGITRISCGIQSFCNASLKFCNRRADLEKNLFAINLLNQKWKGDLSFDLITGLPCDDEKTISEAISKLSETKAQHLSVYSLVLEDETPLGKYFLTHDYDFDSADALWLKAEKLLSEKGFEQYEVSNFCKNGKMSLHNLCYWNHESYLGCGSGATGTFYLDDGSAFRYTNSSDIKKYCDFWLSKSEQSPIEVETVSKEDSIFEFFMMGLRKRSGISRNHFENCFNQNLPENFLEKITEYEKKGLACIEETENDKVYRLNKKGILFLNSFLESL